MKPFTRIKKINGQEYIYEITPYYDPEKKQIRQKSKYLGKNVGGVPVKVRSTEKIPKKVLSHGTFALFFKIIKNLELESVLSETLPKVDVWPVLTLAINLVTGKKGLTDVQSWYEGTSISVYHPNLPLSTQNLHRILSEIGDGEINLNFSQAFLKRSATKKVEIYDIRYNRSHLSPACIPAYDNVLGQSFEVPKGVGLQKVNLSLVIDADLQIPVMYDVYSHRTSDLSDFVNAFNSLKRLNVDNHALVLDETNYSHLLVQDMASSKIPFVIPLAIDSVPFKKIVFDIYNRIDDPKHLKLHENEPLFVMPLGLSLCDDKICGYAYYNKNYNKKRGQLLKSAFYADLNELVERLKAVNLLPWMDPGQIVCDVAKTYARFVEWKAVDDKLDVSINWDFVKEAIDRMGLCVLLYQGNLSWDECLSLYKRRAEIEKSFDDITKPDIGTVSNVYKMDDVLRGYLFVAFLALILKIKLNHMIKASGLDKRYSVKGSLTELEKIALMVFSKGDVITTEVSKTQREILDALQIDVLSVTARV